MKTENGWKAIIAAMLLSCLPNGAIQAQLPDLEIVLHSRTATGTPTAHGTAWTGGGNIQVSQPAPNIVLFTMSGVAVAGGHLVKNSVADFRFNLQQDFDVIIRDPKLKQAKLLIAGRVVGLLRSQCLGHKACCQHGGIAEISMPGHAAICLGDTEIVSLALPAHSATGGENYSVNDHEGPVAIPVQPGRYTLHQTFGITASHARSPIPCKKVSAEFAPAPALDPSWIKKREPFHGAEKSNFGFQILLKLVPN
ncbi:MAG: hypothetical protein KatS3mg105_0350 [Gemmatales bacterium]|nr:MAG: hypothetical protein KatS3mg105_0350 [Gemmatales bacterium]